MSSSSVTGSPRTTRCFASRKKAAVSSRSALDGKIGLVQHAFRPQVREECIDQHLAVWPYESFDGLAPLIGRSSWEFPRGYTEKTDKSGHEGAKREGSEETGSAVIASLAFNRTCGNTSIEPHYMAFSIGLVDTNKTGLPGDPNEKLLKGLTFLELEEIHSMIAQNEIYCGHTLSGLQIIAAYGGSARVINMITQT